MHRASSKAVDGGAVTSVVGIRPHGRGRGQRVPVMSSRILLLSACLVGLAQPLGAQAPRVEMRVGFSDFSYMLHVGPPWLGQRWVGQSGVSVSSSLRLWSSGPVSVAGEVSANVRLPDRIPNACPDIPGAVCDFRDIGDVIRFGFSSRVGKRDGAGPYALAAAGWWGTLLSGDVYADNRVVKQSQGDRVGGLALDLGAGTSLPVGDRRTGIELRAGVLGGVQRGRTLQLGLTRRW